MIVELTELEAQFMVDLLNVFPQLVGYSDTAKEKRDTSYGIYEKLCDRDGINDYDGGVMEDLTIDYGEIQFIAAALAKQTKKLNKQLKE